MANQWAQVTDLDNSKERCDNAHCNDLAIKEYVVQDGSIFFYCKDH
tara:strand:- start:2644 stop:2781 length:138 start_codon:yes stop_codon:yes gene_type:complete